MPGADFDDGRPEGLNGIDDGDGGRLTLVQGGENIGDVGFGGEQHVGVVEPQALGAQPHLGDGLFAGDINDAGPGAGERGQGLEEEGGFADAGIAANQHAGAGHEAAAGHPVQFGNAGLDAGQRGAFAAQAHQAGGLALGEARPLGAGNGGRALFLNNGVPFAAIIAAPGPFGRGAAAGLADET